MKKIIIILVSVVTVISFSCGTQKNTPNGTNPVDTTQPSVDSTKPGK